MVKFYFIRHGETDFNKLGISQGHKAVNINEKGRKQATLTGNYLKQYRNKLKFNLIISSPLLRAKQTSKIIADILKIKDIIYNDNLKELDMGDFTGKIKTEKYQIIRNQINNLQKKFKDPIEFHKNKYKIDNYMFKNYKMETNKNAQLRAKKFIKSLTKLRKYNKVIIVSHGKILSNLFSVMFKIPYKIDSKLNMSKDNNSNCFISLVELKKKFKMITLPSNLHLDIIYLENSL